MKTFFSTLAGLIVVIILAAVVVGFVFWSRLPDMAANNLSKKLKVTVEIDSFGLSWGKIDAKNIQVGNPPGTILAKAFTCREIDVLAPFTNYLRKRIIIDEIDLQDVYLGLEFDSASGTSGNWTRIMKNLQDSTGTATSEKADKQKKRKEKQAPPPPPSDASRSVLIHRIVLTNIDVDVVYRKEGGKVKKLPRIPRIELTEVSSEGGLPMDQILNSVLGEMLKEIFIKENLNNMINELPGNIKKYVEPFRGFFNAVPEEINQDAVSA